MSDQCEEQEMEAEALTAIFDTSFEILSSEQPFKWSVDLFPHMDDFEEGSVNHVGVKLVCVIPLEYPEHTLPELTIEILKGLAPHHEEELLALAKEEAEANMGVPSIYAICERLKEWLTDNNIKGQDDLSMHAQMLRKQKEAEKKEQLAKQRELEYESQKKGDEFTEAELEEMAVRKRRAEGTPCTEENFKIWLAEFQKEMAEKETADKKKAEEDAGKGAKKNAVKDKREAESKAGRKTGKEQFSNTAMVDLAAIEAAADQAAEEQQEEEEDEEEEAQANGAATGELNEELFDVDDEDLDDLDFDDDDEEEQPDI